MKTHPDIRQIVSSRKVQGWKHNYSSFLSSSFQWQAPQVRRMMSTHIEQLWKMNWELGVQRDHVYAAGRACEYLLSNWFHSLHLEQSVNKGVLVGTPSSSTLQYKAINHLSSEIIDHERVGRHLTVLIESRHHLNELVVRFEFEHSQHQVVQVYK